MILSQQQLRDAILRVEVLAGVLRNGRYPFSETPDRLECAALLDDCAHYMRAGFDPGRELPA
jgi:hypothetical protein